jgi:hypothetical protein
LGTIRRKMISAQVLSSEIDENGNIKVKTEYILTDGSKTIGHTRYSTFNFSKDLILQDIKSQCENLIRKVYCLKQNQELVKTDLTDISYSCSEVEIVTKPEILDKDMKVVVPAEKITIDDK